MTENNLTRRESRENAFLAAFSATFQTDAPQEALQAHNEAGTLSLDAFANRLLADLMAHQEEIDAAINAHLKGWALSRIPPCKPDSHAHCTGLRCCTAKKRSPA